MLLITFFLILEFYSPVPGQKHKLKTCGHFGSFQEINEIIRSDKKQNRLDTLLKTKEAAIKYAEPFLFKAFGESQILSEKPYVVTFNAENWSIMGTLKKRKGGTFLIIIHSVDGRIIKLTHGK